MSIEGFAPGSYPSRGEMNLKTKGRTKPAKTDAEECIPGEPV
jgi:hypothetical protein